MEKEREREREGGEYRRSRSQRATFPPLPTPPYVVVVNNVRFDVNLPVSIESNERVEEEEEESESSDEKTRIDVTNASGGRKKGRKEGERERERREYNALSALFAAARS